jgi:hypothetical protein
MEMTCRLVRLAGAESASAAAAAAAAVSVDLVIVHSSCTI